MSEQERAKIEHTERRKPGRPADHRCSACGVYVPDPASDDAHVCVPDDKGAVEALGMRWRATTHREHQKERHGRP